MRTPKNLPLDLLKTTAALLLAAALPVTTVTAADSLAATEANQKENASKTRLKYEAVLKAAQQTPPAPGSVICIGSSHMELWKTVAADLAPLRVHNHGVGGSKMSQAAELYIENLAIQFNPRAVILYEGSNDVAGDVAPETILEHFKTLHTRLHSALPDARLYVLSIVPSPGKRFEKIDVIRKTNGLLRKECESQPWIKFIDITEPLISTDGVPIHACFIPGNIHMTPAGYEVWKTAIAPVILPIEKPFEK